MSTEQIRKYEYSGLQTRSIRILRLKSMPLFESELECDFIISKLEDAPSFEAVSYVWGEDVFPEQVLFDRGIIKITKSASEALRRFRQPSERLLWIDAICINQKDDSEKSHQVEMMTEIYRRAKAVLGWIGPASDVSAHSIQTFKEVSKIAENLGISPKSSDMLGNFAEDVAKRNPQFFKEDTTKVWTTIFNGKFEDIVGRPWFKRMWIVQEVVVSKKITLFAGNEAIDMDDLFRVIALVVAISRYHGQDLMQDLIRCWNLQCMRTDYPAITSPHFFCSAEHSYNIIGPNIARSSLLQCRDDRDRVYALSGLLPSHGKIKIIPDYKKTTKQVYVDFARQYIENSSLSILYHAGLYDRLDILTSTCSDCSSDLPSWVPEIRPAKIRPVEIPFEPNDFRSCLEPGVGRAAYLIDDCIVVLGYRVDYCEMYMMLIPGELSGNQMLTEASLVGHASLPADNENSLYLQATIKLYADKIFPNGQYLTGEDIRVAIMRTLTADFSQNNVKGLFTSQEKLIDIWKALDISQYLLKQEYKSPQGTAMLCERDLRHIPEHFLNSLAAYYKASESVLRRSRFFFTRQGYMGIAPCIIEDKDLVVLIDGMNTPFLMRQSTHNPKLNYLIGPCYLHGAMYGELRDNLEADIIAII